ASKPEDLIKNLKKETLNQIVSLLDTGDDGFFTHDFSSELRTANWIFRIPSGWARGSIELIMLSVIIQKEIEIKEYQLEMKKFIDQITKIDDLYKAFYIHNPSSMHKSDIQKRFKTLNSKLDKLYKILSLKSVETEGRLIKFKDFQKLKTVSIPEIMIHNLQKLTKNKNNLFIVHRIRGDSLKLDIIPVTSKEITKLEIIFGTELTPAIMEDIVSIFSKYNISLIFTAGICTEADKCIYEVYIELLNKDNLEPLKNEIYEIEGVIDIQTEKLSA
ncbi:MAG: hypothetical protein KAX33_12180, partial [Candidatus Lokiarchaeota archaeon]|nr:hypothetical protein [Candidatus Lokiarchaeota archaeon]